MLIDRVATLEKLVRRLLASGGKVELMDEILDSDNIVYVLDESLTIVQTNDAYRRFADENSAGPEFHDKFGEGSQVLSVIPEQLRPFYESLYRKAFSGEVVEHDYDCHSPSSFRRFRLRLLPLEDGRVAVENSLRVERVWTDTEELDDETIAERYVASTGLIVQCMHCRRVKATGPTERWDMIPSMIDSRDRRVSHGLCAACLRVYYPD